MTARVVRRDGLREAVTALRDEWISRRGGSFWVTDELTRVLDAVPDVPPDPEAVTRALAEHRDHEKGRTIEGQWWWTCACGEPLSPNLGDRETRDAHEDHLASVLASQMQEAQPPDDDTDDRLAEAEAWQRCCDYFAAHDDSDVRRSVVRDAELSNPYRAALSGGDAT